jgi:uncharacterized protein YprB with RNaseH-like and TPR domain
VTWAGKSADIPVLRAALEGAELHGLLDDVFARHLDLYQHVIRSNRWPIPELGLKEVSEYLMIQRASTVGDGMQAQSMYLELGHTEDRARQSFLRAALAEYCRDDLDSLIQITRRLTEHPESPRALSGC